MTLSKSSPGTWFTRHAHLVSAEGKVLDLACGTGRHARFFADRGHRVTALDRDLSGVADLQEDKRFILIEADLEGGLVGGLDPLAGKRYDAVLVSNYLWRPLAADLMALVAPGGVLLYQTFGMGNECFGRPRNPEFLLAPGELLSWLDESFTVVSYEHGVEAGARVVQRLAAIRSSGPVNLPG